jgi:hypothetical protein
LANPNVFFLWEIWVDYVQKVCNKKVYCCLNIPYIWPTLFFQRFKLNISSISHQQAIAERWDLPNTEIFQSKDIASGWGSLKILSEKCDYRENGTIFLHYCLLRGGGPKMAQSHPQIKGHHSHRACKVALK